jgi:hypothetical protein
MIQKIRRFFNNIKMIIDWIPILWGNWDWDWTFLFEVLIFKLNRMEKYFSESDIAEDNEKIAKQIKEVTGLLKRLKEDDYWDEIAKELHFCEKYGNLKLRLLPIEDSDNSLCEFYYEKDGVELSKETKEEADELRHGYMFKEAKKRKTQEAKKAFGTIAKFYQNWWE